MKYISDGNFYGKFLKNRIHLPLSALLELTYRCNLNCVHCYCKGSEDRDRELGFADWKKILNTIHKEGCIWLTFTGGEPLIREDFLEIYSYAKARGFIITLLTNAQAFTAEIIDYLIKFPPKCIEITLNGISKDTYEAITQVEGSYLKATQNIKILAKKKLPLIIKANCLKQNKNEIGKIKVFAEELLGKPSENLHLFKYDPIIYPRIDGDKTPTNFRLSFKELLEVRRQDVDIWQEHQERSHNGFPDLKRDKKFLYSCNMWMTHFFINPYGRLKSCLLSDKFSINLKTTPFKEGFYKIFPQLFKEQFKSSSKCRDCSLRPLCHYCPARAHLEIGDEEAPVPYFCELAKETAKYVKT